MKALSLECYKREIYILVSVCMPGGSSRENTSLLSMKVWRKEEDEGMGRSFQSLREGLGFREERG